MCDTQWHRSDIPHAITRFCNYSIRCLSRQQPAGPSPHPIEPQHILMQVSRHQTGTIQAARSHFSPLHTLSIYSSRGRTSCPSSRQHFHIHARPVTSRGQMRCLASSSDDILKTYGISPTPGDIGSSNSSSSSKPVPIKQPTAGEHGLRTRIHAYPCNVYPEAGAALHTLGSFLFVFDLVYCTCW